MKHTLLSESLWNNAKRLTVALATSLLVSQSAYAGQATWNSASGTSWATGAYWLGGTGTGGVAGVADDVVFDNRNLTIPTTISLDAAQSAKSLTFGSSFGTALGAFNLEAASTNTAETLTLASGGITMDSRVTGTVTVGANSGTNGVLTLVATGNAFTIANNSATQNLVIAGLLTNNGATAATLNASGVGTVVLSGTNTFTGATTISAGSIRLDNLNALATSASVTVKSVNGLTFNNTNSGGSTYNVLNFAGTANESLQDTGANAVTLSVANTSAATYSGILSGSGGLSQNSGNSSVLTLTGANTFIGATTINSGIINYQNATAFGTNSAITVSGTGAAAQVQGGIAGGSQTLTLLGTGVGTLGALESVSGNNSYAGSIVLTGTTDIGVDAGTLALTGTITGSGGILRVITAGSSTATLSNVVSGMATLQKQGSGTLILSGANNYTLTNFNSGTSGIINFRDPTAFGTNSAITVNFTGDTVQVQGGIAGGSQNMSLIGTGTTGSNGALENVNGSNSYGGAVNLTGNTTISSDAGTLTLNGGVSENAFLLTVNGAGNIAIATTGITGSGASAIAMNGPGTLILSAANSMTGAISVAGGAIDLQTSPGGSLVGTNNLTFVAGLGGTFNYDNTGASGAQAQSMGTLTFSAGEGTVLSTFGGASSSALTFSSLAGRTKGATGNIVVAGGTSSTNQVILTGVTANAFINAGLFFNGSNYAFNDATGFVRGINYGTDPNSVLNTGGATLGAVTSSSNVEITGAITADTTTAINTLQIAGANNFTQSGSPTLSLNGILKSGGNAAAISGGTLTTAGGADLVIRTDASGDVLTISDAITTTGATGGLTKSGAGTLILTGTNLYTGVTNINAGTLQVGNGVSSSNLGTTGVVDNALLVYNNGAPSTVGNAISGAGALTVAGNTVILTGGNSYSGQTTVNSGATLQVGNGTSGSISGSNNITNNGTLAYDLSGGGTYSGVISGTGGLTQMLSTLILTGTNTYTGGTTINSGTTIQVGNASTAGFLPVFGAVVDNGALNFDNTGTSVLDGNISGTGTLTHEIGNLILGGNNSSWSGGSTLYTFGGATIIGSNTALGTGNAAIGNNVSTYTIQADNNTRSVSNSFSTPDSLSFGNGGNLTLSGTTTLSGGPVITMRNSGTTTFGSLNFPTLNKTMNLTLSYGGGSTVISGPVTYNGSTSNGMFINYNGVASTFELAGSSTLTASTQLAGSASGYFLLGNDNALGGAFFQGNLSNGSPSQILLIGADPNHQADTMSNGAAGQIITTGSIGIQTQAGLGGSANIQFNIPVAPANFGIFNNQSTGTTIFHSTFTAGANNEVIISGEGTGGVIFDPSSTYGTSAGVFVWNDGNSTLTLSGTDGSTTAVYLQGGTVILDTGTANVHISSGSGNTILSGVNLVLQNISSSALNTNQTVGSYFSALGTGQTNISHAGGSTATFDIRGMTSYGSSTGNGTGDINFADGTVGKNTNAVVENGILMPGEATVGTINSADWATLGGTGSTLVVALAAYTAFPGGTGGSTANNYSLSGTGSTSGAFTAQTLKIASTTSGQSLTLGGTLTFSDTSSHTSLGGSGGLLYQGSNAYTITGGGLADTGANGAILTIQQWGSGNLTIASPMSGTTTLVKAGPGQLTLTSTAQTNTGPTYINDGILSISTNSNLNQAVTTAVNGTVTSSTTSSTAQVSANAPALGGIFLGQTVIGVNGTNVQLSGNANATLVAAAALSQSYTYDPAIVLNGGTLQATASFTLASGSTPRPILLGNDGGTIDVTGSNVLTVSGIINGVGFLAKTDTGTLLLTGAANNYLGGTTVTGGTLQFGVSNSLNNLFNTGSANAGFTQALTSPVLVNGGTIDLAGTTQDFGPVTMTSGSIIDSVGGGLVNAYSYAVQSGTISASLGDANARHSGAGVALNAALTKTTAGTVTLSGASNYSGMTSINAGTLVISGSTLSTGLVTVASGATLSGTGSTGIVSVSGGGAINLQDGVIGTLTVGGLGTIGTSGTTSAILFDIRTLSGVTTVDNIVDNGTLTVNGTNANGTGGTTITIGNLTGTSTLNSGSYALLTYTGQQQALSSFNLLTTSLDSQSLSLTQTGDTVFLTIGGATSTTYNLLASAANARVIKGGSTTVTATITNTGGSGADTLNYTGLTTNGSLSGGTLPKSGGPLANSGGTDSGTATLAVGNTTGNQTVTPTVSTATNATVGGSAALGTTTTATVDVVDNRVVTATSVALGREMVGQATSGVSNLSTTGSDLTNTRVTVGTAGADVNGISATGGTNPTYNSASVTDTRTVGGTFSTAGSTSGSLTLTTTGEGLTGEAPVNVSVAYTADPVNKRVITNGAAINLGTLHNGAAVSTTSNAFTTTGTHTTTTDVTVAAGSGTINGITISGGPTTFNGTSSSDTRNLAGNISNGSGGTTAGTFNLGVTGEGLTGEGSYSNVGVGYTSFVYTGAGVWNTNGGGSWGVVSASPANWTANGGTPGLDSNFTSTDSATFGNVLTSGTANVTLSGDNPSLNAITFNNTNGASYNLAGTGGGSITLNGGAGSSTVTDTAGTHTISAPVILGTNANINVASGQQLTFSGVVSGSGKFTTTTGTGTTILSNANIYSGTTAVNAGTLYANGGVAGTSSATGTGAITVASGAALGGSGVIRPTISGAGITLAGGSTLISGGIQAAVTPTTTAGVGLTLDNTSAAGTILNASVGTANLTFYLGAGNLPSQPVNDFASPNTNSTYMTVLGNTANEVALATGDTITVNDLTGVNNLQLNLSVPYLLIQAGTTPGLLSDNNLYSGLVTSGGVVLGNLQNGWVTNLTLSGTAVGENIAPRLYLYNGDLEVVPEPGTWAMMLGGLAVLFFQIRRRKNNLS